jgi:hypothetical protein
MVVLLPFQWKRVNALLSRFCVKYVIPAKGLIERQMMKKMKGKLYAGSAPSMETDGVKRIFECSEATHKLQQFIHSIFFINYGY